MRSPTPHVPGTGAGRTTTVARVLAVSVAGILDEATLTRTGRGGRFTLDVPDGEHLLCQVGDGVRGDGPEQTAGLSRWTSGCDVVTVDGPTTWRVTQGEGGVNVSDEG